MTGAELINEAIAYYDNTLATDATNAQRRLRVLHSAQLVLEEVYNFKAWPFKYKVGTVVTTAGAGALPADYGRLGPEGSVVDSAKAVWTETTLQEIYALRAGTDQPLIKVFAIGLGSTASTNYNQLVVPDTVASYTFQVGYDRLAPTLTDAATEITVIPKQYHRTVLLAGTVARMQTLKSDVRQFWLGQYAMGLGRMQANEMPMQSRVQQLPLFQRGQW